MTQGKPDDPAGDKGPAGDPPELPDAAPDPVQDLLDGIWSAGNGVAGGIGDAVSRLAKAIGDAVGNGGNSTESIVDAVAFVVDAAGVFF